MHAYIITGGKRETRLQEIKRRSSEFKVNQFDKISLGSVEMTSIGIAEVREFQHAMTIAPAGGNIRLGLIYFAEILTIDAQQALLKTLEEPPPHAKIILETQNIDTLLPTIISRCQIITLVQTEKPDEKTLELCRKTIEQIQRTSTGQRLKTLEAIGKTKEEVSAWITLAIFAARDALLVEFGPAKICNKSQTIANHELLQKLLTARRQLEANVNPKLVLDNVFI